MKRACVAALLACAALATVAASYDPVVPGVALRFPEDRGAHPGHRIEWWYVTGELDGPRGPLGFQVTFFRVRNPDAEGRESRFAPKQLVFAHAAVSDPNEGRILHDQRSARELPPLVEAKRGETGVRLDDWSFAREADRYVARIPAGDFSLDLALVPTQPVLLQGDRGFSRKGASGAQASYYYSEPHLAVSGRVRVRGSTIEVKGRAWLDHEWSSELLASEAAGWDWLGANLDDGGALMAFRIRGKDGGTMWSTATVRAKDGEPSTIAASEVAFAPVRTWTSSRTGTAYPVEMRVKVGPRTWRLIPLMDDQEMDARSSTGTLYWEGAVSLRADDGATGRGYLELTGYARERGRRPF